MCAPVQPPDQILPRVALWPLWGLSIIISFSEVVLLGADYGFWGSPIWRPLAYQWGGFWAGLWHGWQPNYAAQPGVMLLLYTLLHAGPGHLLGNLLGLWIVGRAILGKVGAGGLIAIWIVGSLGGAATFGLLTSSTAPMVGASGAIFALAGAWGWFDAMELPTHMRRWGRALRLAAFGVAVNLGMILLTPGGIAWETHLGGTLAGVTLATVWTWKRAAQ